jgi:ribosomal protein L28
MAQICEITRKRIPHFSNLPADQKKDSKVRYRQILKRKIKVPEIKGSINLKVSIEGLELVKKAGGLAAFLKDRADNKLSPQLLKIKRKIYGEPKKEEKPAPEAAAAAPKAEAAPSPAAPPKAEAAPAPAATPKAEAAPEAEAKKE